tara:strand:- start:792 stop:1202 length:411 start_codon:yes stop_codon:yes gene_type:complete
METNIKREDITAERLLLSYAGNLEGIVDFKTDLKLSYTSDSTYWYEWLPEMNIWLWKQHVENGLQLDSPKRVPASYQDMVGGGMEKCDVCDNWVLLTDEKLEQDVLVVRISSITYMICIECEAFLFGSKYNEIKVV